MSKSEFKDSLGYMWAILSKYVCISVCTKTQPNVHYYKCLQGQSRTLNEGQPAAPACRLPGVVPSAQHPELKPVPTPAS